MTQAAAAALQAGAIDSAEAAFSHLHAMVSGYIVSFVRNPQSLGCAARTKYITAAT